MKDGIATYKVTHFVIGNNDHVLDVSITTNMADVTEVKELFVVFD